HSFRSASTSKFVAAFSAMRSPTIISSRRLSQRLAVKFISKKERPRKRGLSISKRVGRDALKGVPYMRVPEGRPLLCDDANVRTHPWMDAALIVFDTFVVFHFARGLTRLEDRTGRLGLGAFGDLGQAQDVV